MGVAFIPIYIKYLGIEAYGLIGFFVVVQGFLNLLDMGMTATLGRVSSKYTGGEITNNLLRDLIRTYEIVAGVVILIATLAMLLLNNHVANWLNTTEINNNTLNSAILLMGLLFSVRFGESFYRSIIIGMQKHFQFNIINSIYSTLKWAGVILILEYVDNSIIGFFIWQIAISLLLLINLSLYAYSSIPASSVKAKFDIKSLRINWKYTKGMALITLTVFLLTNIDKLIITKFLQLSDFGHYTLILTISTALSMIGAPIAQTLLPKMTQNISEANYSAYEEYFHIGAQLISILIGGVGLLIIFYPQQIFYIWTFDEVLSEQMAQYLRIYCVGTLINGMMVMPYIAQLAKGETKLTVKINLISIFLLTPIMAYYIHDYGIIAAVSLWLLYNLSVFLISPLFIFKNILQIKMKEWYLKDIILPLLFPIIILLLSKLLEYEMSGRFELILHVFTIGVFVLAGAIWNCELIKPRLIRILKRGLKNNF
jgi:O-antigen/teichoic acid export membrane protein